MTALHHLLNDVEALKAERPGLPTGAPTPEPPAHQHFSFFFLHKVLSSKNRNNAFATNRTAGSVSCRKPAVKCIDERQEVKTKCRGEKTNASATS